MKLLQYPVTRSIALGQWFNIFIILLGIGWVSLITIINIAAVGYELVPFTTTIYNTSATLWYERLPLMTSWFPQGRSCDGSIIKLGEGFHFLLRVLIESGFDQRYIIFRLPVS